LPKVSIMSPQSLTLTSELHQYIIDTGIREPHVLTELRRRTAKHPAQQMLLAPEQGQLLSMLIKLIGANRPLDIGTFTGYSSTVVALALPDDGTMISCDVNETDTTIAREFWTKAGVESKIELRLAPALETLDSLVADGQSDTFDFSFIDADKGNYINYFQRSLELVRVGGLIAVDNTLWSGRVLEAEPEQGTTVSIKSFNSYAHAEDRVELVMVPVGDGLTLARKLR